MSIQIDNGDFTRLHNTILERLALARFNASEYRCLMYLFRQTYGWQKKEDAISLSQWAAGTGIDTEKRHNALRTLQGLAAKRVIYSKSNGNNHTVTWGFNKNFEEWDASLFQETVISPDNTSVMPVDNRSEETVISPDNSSVISPDNRTVISPDNHKRKIKERLKKDTAMQPATQDKAPTPQQEMFGAICEAIGWDYRVVSAKNKGQVAQTIGVLTKAQYGVEDIRRFMVEIWFKDWRWEKHGQHPTLEQLRQDIGKLRSVAKQVAPPKRKGVDGYREMLAEQGIHHDKRN